MAAALSADDLPWRFDGDHPDPVVSTVQSLDDVTFDSSCSSGAVLSPAGETESSFFSFVFSSGDGDQNTIFRSSVPKGCFIFIR